MSLLIALVIAGVAAALLTPILAAAGVRLRLVDRPGHLKIHDRPVPVTGGPTVAIAALAGASLAGSGDPWVGAAVAVGLAGGMIDDVRPQPPWIRLVAQSAAGGLLVASGLRLEALGALSGVGLVLVTVACCNAVNMLDGQDGLAAGLGAIAALGLAGVLAVNGAPTGLPLGLAGALLGFLVWNRPPARVFLGDSGAYAIGVLLTASAAQVSIGGWPAMLAAGACLGVFAYELVSTVVRRAVAAAPASLGDRGHSYDRLAVRLDSRTASALVVWALGVGSSLVAIAVIHVDAVAGVALIAAMTLLTAVLDIRLIPSTPTKEGR